MVQWQSDKLSKTVYLCHSLLPYVLWSLWLNVWTSKQFESWWINDGNHKARKHKLNLGCTKIFWLKTDTFWPEDLGLSADISISFTLLDNWNGSLHLIKHKQNAKISYSFILYPVSSITPSSHNRLCFYFSNFNSSFPQKYHHTSLSPIVHNPHSLSNYIT